MGSEPPAARWNNEVAESRSFSCPLSVLIFPYVAYQPANRGGSFLRNVGSFSHPEDRSLVVNLLVCLRQYRTLKMYREVKV